MQKGFVVFGAIILLIGLAWVAVHLFGSEQLNKIVGYGSAGLITLVIALYLLLTYRKKKNADKKR